MPTQAFFLPADGPAGGQRLCLYHPAQGTPRGALVYVHPFAEEMNKSRRMAAVASRAFADAGYAVLQIDLFGCGDSSGDFGDAAWGDWVDDVVQGARWLQDRVDAPLWLWGLRAGCLLTCEAARRLSAPPSLLWWAPVTSGKLQWQQFLRLKTAAEMLQGQAGGGAAALKAELAAGRPVEVAGYLIAPALAQGLERASLSAVATVPRLQVLEAGAQGADPSPAVANLLSAWQREGVPAAAAPCAGPAFWQTSEIEEAPAFIERSLASLRAVAAPIDTAGVAA